MSMTIIDRSRRAVGWLDGETILDLAERPRGYVLDGAVFDYQGRYRGAFADGVFLEPAGHVVAHLEGSPRAITSDLDWETWFRGEEDLPGPDGEPDD